MDILEIRRLMKIKSIFEIPLRVTFYARVSTDKDEQLNSLTNQISYYKDLITKNVNWEYIDGYIDEGLSGMTTKKRENFHKMIEDASLKKFDLIITKEISRFARNTLDSIKYTRKLFTCGVGVLFQNDNINTLDEDSELRLTIMSGIAQDEVRKLSSRIKFGHQQAIKDSVVLGNGRIFGYRKHNKRLVIDEDQAAMVKEIFQLYATGEYSMKQIENILWDKGYRNNNGNKISHTTMANVISNPKYKGYYVGNKVRIVDMFTKKQKFLPEDEWVMFKDDSGEIVPQIVEDETWEKANKVLKRRSADVKSRQNKCNHNNLLTGKMHCSYCNLPYYRKDSVMKNGKPKSAWRCSGKIKNGALSCPSVQIYEDEIKEVLFDLFSNMPTNVTKTIDKYLEIYNDVSRTKDLENQLNEYQAKIAVIENKKSKLLEYNIEEKISDSDFLSMNKKCTVELEDYLKKAKDIQIQISFQENAEEEVRKMKDDLTKAVVSAQNRIIDLDFIDSYIEKIVATPDKANFTNKVEQIVQIDVVMKNIGEKVSYRSIKSRTGHTFKKMVEAYENSVK